MALLLLEPVLPNKLNGLKQKALVLAPMLEFALLVLLLVLVLAPILVLVPESSEVISVIVELLRT
ncbi:MAG: hypothetical protein QJT80_12690 [Candidatus Thiocaldithrix dubininis]|uniref:Uncharacterized protein n=1 Tax=Candidatus Thiocaldithrix dubininis TaxID=3080823 RepID=A0AA95KJI4_9GAMM|nr:MAG: hypothetical protein QJT80_12690 [Candidatus Thiocaldithrix dubininis]